MSDDVLTKAMEVFKEHFRPAASVKESDEQWTTTEILDKFCEHLGEEAMEVEQLVEMLIRNGYIYDYLVDGFKWLTKSQ